MLHIAATAQGRHDTEGRRYQRRKLADGKTQMAAMRCLKRWISDAVHRQPVANARRPNLRGSLDPGDVDAGRDSPPFVRMRCGSSKGPTTCIEWGA
jgi:hypothetical protein